MNLDAIAGFDAEIKNFVLMQIQKNCVSWLFVEALTNARFQRILTEKLSLED